MGLDSLIVSLLRSRPLQTDAKAVGIFKVHLLHIVVRNFGFVGFDARLAEVSIGAVQVLAREVKGSIAVGSDADGIGCSWTLVIVVGGVEHQLAAGETQQAPAKVVARLPWFGGSGNFAVK